MIRRDKMQKLIEKNFKRLRRLIFGSPPKRFVDEAQIIWKPTHEATPIDSPLLKEIAILRYGKRIRTEEYSSVILQELHSQGIPVRDLTKEPSAEFVVEEQGLIEL